MAYMFSSRMILRHVTLTILTAFLVSSCDDSVPLNYSTRAEAEAESLFARGWLPEIIPPSSRDISMRNDLDLNISNGAFSFDAADHDGFVAHLERSPSRDEGGSTAYAYEDWIFWIYGDKNHCRFSMHLTQNEKPSEQGAGGNGGQAR